MSSQLIHGRGQVPRVVPHCLRLQLDVDLVADVNLVGIAHCKRRAGNLLPAPSVGSHLSVY
eukprot:7230141-Lingulodinium_polyedra.AAC.1